MTYRLNPETKLYDVYFSKRHPVTGRSHGLRRIKIKTEAEARRVERELVAAVELQINQTKSPPWSVVVKEHLQSCRENGLSNHTVHDYQTGLEAYTIEPWGNRPVDSITTLEIRELIPAKVGDKSVGHQKNILKFIRGVFNYAAEAGYIDRNPCPKMKFKIGDKIKAVLTEDQLRILLDRAKASGNEWYPVWVLASHLGMRNGELFALTWDKVDLDNRLVRVDTSWSNKNGFKSTKSGDDRLVEIPESILPLFKQLKLQSEGTPYVLPRIDRWDQGDQARELRHFLMGIGLPRIRFHDLRATWATLLLQKGVEPIKVMTAGGWKDLKTMQMYIRKAGVNIRGMTACLDLHDPLAEHGKVLQIRSGSNA